MNTATEKSCLDEISALVLDASEKVTLKTISNNWEITNDAAREVLMKWLDQNVKKVNDILKEFLVRGVNSKGVFTIGVVSEDKKNVLEKKWKDFSSWLYSIETKSNSRKLNLPNTDPIKVKNIVISATTPREFCIAKSAPVAKDEPLTSKASSSKNPFVIQKPDTKPIEKKTDVKIKSENNVAGMFKQQEKKGKVVKESSPEVVETPQKLDESPKHVKQEKLSPEEAKSKDTKTTGKKSTLKNHKPAQKGGISNFFKPGACNSASAAKPDGESLVEKESSKELKKTKELSRSKRRSLTPDAEIPTTSVESKHKKTTQIKLKPSNKRSRIQQIEDSSEDESENIPEEPESKLIKFDREFTPEPEEASEIMEKSPPKQIITEKSKHKAKRWVTKRFQADDGFMKTERVLEEYTASEDENDENQKKNSPAKQNTIIEKKSTKTSTKAKSPKAKSPKKAPAAGKPKQGSITSFFNRK